MNIKITQAAVEAGARAMRDMAPDAMFKPYHTYLEQAKACITTALPHLETPIQPTPAPSSLAESAGEGGLNSDCKVSPQNVQSHAAIRDASKGGQDGK